MSGTVISAAFHLGLTTIIIIVTIKLVKNLFVTGGDADRQVRVPGNGDPVSVPGLTGREPAWAPPKWHK